MEEMFFDVKRDKKGLSYIEWEDDGNEYYVRTGLIDLVSIIIPTINNEPEKLKLALKNALDKLE